MAATELSAQPHAKAAGRDRDGVILRAAHLRKTYRLGRVAVPVLRGAALDVRAGEWVAVLGASGSGKSTLLHLLGGLDRPDRGGSDGHPPTIEFGGRELTRMGAGELDEYRNVSVGFVFQFYHLLPELNVLENAAAPAMVRYGRLGWRARRRDVLDRTRALLESFGLSERLRHRPAELSGGERQRVAIARALVNDPPLVLADEPTGNLDQATGASILDVLGEYHARTGLSVVMVTHDPQVAARASRVVRLIDGRVAADGVERAGAVSPG